jgi:orotate phosphoribosyltransferase
MPDDVLTLFERAGAYLRGHFLLTSGRHSDVYFEKFALLQFPDIVTDLCRRLAEPFQDRQVATVVGPTLGGVIIAYELARQLGCRAVYAEAQETGRALRRGYALDGGERVLLCDDILTTGRSVREVITLAESYAADIVGLALLLDRSGGGVNVGYPVEVLARIEASSYDPSACPQCAQGLALTQRGSRKI